MLETNFFQRRPFPSIFFRSGIVMAILAAALGAMWLRSVVAVTVTAVITVNSSADTTIADDGNCTLREAIANINSDSDTTNGDCETGNGNDVIEFAAALNGQTITLAGTELSISDNATINGPGAQLLSISGNDVSRVFNITSGVVEITGITIQSGHVISDNGGGIRNAGTLILRYSAVVNNHIASGGTTDGGGIYNTGTLTITNSAVISNANLGATARGGGIASANGTANIIDSTISGNTSNTWGGGVHNTGSSTMNIVNSAIVNNVATVFWGGGLVVGNGTTAYMKNSLLAYNDDSTGARDCYVIVGSSLVSQGYNLAENAGNCVFLASGDITGQDPNLGPLANNGGLATDYQDNPAAPSGQATWTHALLAGSPAIDQIPNGVNGCAIAQSTDQRGYYRANSCDIGAFEYDGIQVTLAKAVNDDNPGPGQIITYTLIVAVADSGEISIHDTVITDAMPSGINFIGPVTVDGGSGTIITAVPPTLVSGLVISDGTAVTVTFPVSISIGLAGGTVITNTAFVNSLDISTAAMNWQALTVRNVPPVAVADSPIVLEDSGTTSFDVQVNDYDLNGDMFTMTAVGSTDKGGAAVKNGGVIDYAPTENFNGTEVFTYTVSDGALTGTTTVTVTVTPVNDAPVISGGETVTATMNEDGGSIAFSFSGSDVDEDVLSWSIGPGVDTAVISATSGISNTQADIAYTPAPDFTGVDSFTVRASDGALTDTVAVTVTVEPLGDAPRAGDDFVVLTPDDVGVPITLTLLSNDVEVDGQALSLEAIGSPSLTGTVHISGNVAVYTPTLTLGQTETFTYTVSDSGLTDTAVISVTVVDGEASGGNGEALIAANVGSGNSMTMTIEIPTHEANGNESLSVVFTETAVSTDPPEGYDFAGLTFNLDAYVNGVITTPYTLTSPITLTITYNDADITHIVRGEQDLELRYWNGSAWLNDGITLVERDLVNNRLVIVINHLTEFTLLGLPKFYVYLPITINGTP